MTLTLLTEGDDEIENGADGTEEDGDEVRESESVVTPGESLIEGKAGLGGRIGTGCTTGGEGKEMSGIPGTLRVPFEGSGSEVDELSSCATGWWARLNTPAWRRSKIPRLYKDMTLKIGPFLVKVSKGCVHRRECRIEKSVKDV